MNYKDVLESAYNRQRWQDLLYCIFENKVTFWTNPRKVEVDRTRAKEALCLGIIKLSGDDTLIVYEVELDDHIRIEHNRRGLRDLLLSDWRSAGYAGALMFCYRKNESLLRFSYVSETYKFNDQGDYYKQATAPLRYTYLLGEGRPCRTAIERFTALKNSQQRLEDVTTAFSVEALTQQFYKELFDWFQWAVNPDSHVTFPNNVATEDDDREDLEQKIIRMITRIMFVYFIKQKNLVPDYLFNVDYLKTILKNFDPLSTTVGNYYNAILQNLFFATLNHAIDDDEGHIRRFAHSARRDVKNLYRYAELFNISEDEVIRLFATVPFLNGGLFECLDKIRTNPDGQDAAYFDDGFSRNDSRFADGRYKHRAIVPNILFFEPEKGLFSILNRYNFTVEENTPEEQQVALDPELLGKVFENLLGYYNPETRDNARKESGSFYTPREVVNYMVDQCLMAYLGHGDVVEEVFSNHFSYDETKAEDYRRIADKLMNLKALDPACGSGAFPMGLLNRMVDILERISPQADVYQLKLHIIEHCLYGSDIQTIATQITKLRFFISLICHTDRDDTLPNFGMPVLPNLETNFVAANTLVAKNRKNRQLNQQLAIEDPRVESTKKALQDVRHRYFSAGSMSTKRRLRAKDRELCQQLAALLDDSGTFAPDDARQLAAWDPYDQNASAPFFDPEWMFGINDGFDIVIGNPPYVQLQNNREQSDLYQGCGFQTFARTGDMYCLFYERGHQLLRPGGHLCYITSNKWMRADYGGKLRAFFAKHTDPQLLIDFKGVRIFEGVTVDTNILLFERADNRQHTRCAIADTQRKDSIKSNIALFVENQGIDYAFTSDDSWVVLTPIELSIKRKIEAVGTPLKDWNIRINRGILTGFNKAFIISTAKRNEILAHCQNPDERRRTEELIRPILRGKDIKRYGYKWADMWLIATFPARHYRIDDYPAVKEWLLTFAKDTLLENGYDWIANDRDKLHDFCRQKLEQTGKNIIIDGKRIELNDYEKARKKTTNKWFETQDAIAYWQDFSKPKVMYAEIVQSPKFYVDPHGKFFPEATTFIMTGENIEYLIKMLNSRLIAFAFKTFYAGGGLGDSGYRYKKVFLEKLPIPKPANGRFASIMTLSKDSSGEAMDHAIEDTLYTLYNLTDEERELVASTTIE